MTDGHVSVPRPSSWPALLRGAWKPKRVEKGSSRVGSPQQQTPRQGFEDK